MAVTSLLLVSGDGGSAVSLAECKAHLRVDGSEEDALISAMAAAATDYAQQFTGRALTEQTWDWFLEGFPTGTITIPRAPFGSLVGVYYDIDESPESEFSDYSLTSGDIARLALPDGGAWPTTTAARVRFTAGYASGTLPASIRAAILLYLGSLYAHRESVVVGSTAAIVPWSAEQLLRPYRVHLGMA